MTGALIILAVTLLTGLVLYLTHKPDSDNTAEAGGDATTGNGAAPPYGTAGDGGSSSECCGLHAVCEKTMTGIEKPVYFDDEELDRFARRDPATYTADEVEEFREILYTLLPEDVYQWGVSLTLREIAMPVQIRDEWIMLSQENG